MTTSGATARLTKQNKIGLGIAALLGVGDVLSPLSGGGDSGDGSDGPPFGVLIADSVLGLITLAAVIYTWRTASRAGGRVVAGTRILSVVTALPAFFVSGVPAGVVALVAALVVGTAVTVALVLSRPPESD